MPQDLAKGWKNILLFGLEYFSLPLLLKTLFSPWRRIQWSSGKGFSIGNFVQTAISNLISRILGALVRSFLIAAGIVAEGVLFIGAFLSLAAWFLLPFGIIYGFSYGLSILF